MALPHPHSRALSSSPAPLFDLNDSADDRLFLHSSPLTASSLASPDHSNSRCSSPHLFEAPRSPLKLSDSVLPMNSLPSFEFASSGAYVNTYSTIHASTNDGAIVLPPSFSATRHSEGLTSPSPAHSLSSQDAFASPFSAVSPYTGTHFAHNRHASAHSSGGAYPPSSPTESSHSHASLIAERDMDSLSAWGRPVDPRAHPRSLEADASHQFAEQLSLKGAFMQSFPPINRSMTVTVSSAAMDRPSSFGRTPSTSSSHSIDSAPELPDSGVPMFINRSFPLPMPVTVASALQLPYSAPRQPEPAYSQHMQWILPNPSMARAQSDPIAYQPPSSVMPPGSNLPAFLTAGPRQPSMSSLPVRGPAQPPPSGPFYDRLPVDLLTAPSRSSSKRASPALERVESSSLASAPASRSGSPIAFDESSGDLSPVKRARTRPIGSAPPTPSDLRVLVKSEPVESPMARAPINRQAPRVSPTSAKLPRSRSSNFALSLPKPSSSPPAKDHVRHQGVEKQRRDRTRQLFDALQDFTAARVVGPDDLRAPAEVADPFVCAPIDQPRFVKVQRKGIKLPKEHTLTDALNVLQRQEHELSHYRILTAAVTGPDASLAQRARALLASPAEQVVLCSGCGGSLEQCRLEEALRADSPSGQDSRKAARAARPRPFPQ